MPKIVTNDGRLHLAEPAHVNSRPDGLTDTLAAQWAKANELITVNFTPNKAGAAKLLGVDGNTGKPMQMDSIISQFSRLGCYTKADHDQNDNLSEAQYAHKATPPSPATRKVDKVWNVNIMEPDQWRNTQTGVLRTIKNPNPGITVWFRDSARASYNQGGIPIIPGSKQAYTNVQWWTKLGQNFAAWDSALSLDPAIQIINGLQSDTGKIWKPCIGMVEAAFGPLDHKLPTEADWTKLADLTWQSQIDGWTPWLYVKMNADYGSPEWVSFNEYAIPASYILDRGSLLFCQGGKEGTPPGWKTGEFKNSWYTPKIGKPAFAPPSDWRAMIDTRSGVLVKHYTAGVVLFNPHTDGRSVDLGGNNSPIQVDPMSGQILQMQTNFVPLAH